MTPATEASWQSEVIQRLPPNGYIGSHALEQRLELIRIDSCKTSIEGREKFMMNNRWLRWDCRPHDVVASLVLKNKDRLSDSADVARTWPKRAT